MMDNLRFALEGGWKVLWVGVILGAGLPLVFALGIRSLAMGTTGATTEASHEANPAGKALAAICFLAVLVAVGIGITVIVAAGFGKVVSFEHVYPTLVPKS
jgi:amino acid transporter